jgi:glucosamine--fructose-6-phosphate aminotransferase (isomerizing)
VLTDDSADDATTRGTRGEPLTRMAAEIRQIPGLVAGLLDGSAEPVGRAALAIAELKPRWVSMAGRGTSDHAATYGRYLLEAHLGVPVAMAAPSLTTVYEAAIDWRGGLLIAVSQSGRSPDVLAVIAAARSGGALTVTITNDATSPMALAAEHVIPCLAGEEAAVAATKTYVAELVALAALVAALRPRSPLAGALPRLPDVLERCLARAIGWVEGTGIVDIFAAADRVLVASRGYNMATAVEIALKLKETGAVFAEGYSTADLLHGPIALAGAGIPLLAIRSDGPIGTAIDEGVAAAERAGSTAWLIGGREVEQRASVDGSSALALPLDLPEDLTPPVFVLPGQLLAEAVARARGHDPDAPIGLSKVTLTR